MFRFVSFCFIIIFLLSIPFACKKTDANFLIDNKDTKNTLGRFFDKSETANPLIKEVADIILRKENGKPFIKNLSNMEAIRYGIIV